MNSALWILVVILDAGNPYHLNPSVVVEFNTKKICLEAKADALNMGGVIKANCYKKQINKERKNEN